ncbi:MAG: hypothetical protein GW938_08090 [Leptospira sp.]|nr:hypothetical protein [Leptospira sp.]NCS94740.1 hypothetical protein [Leptospira sp.]
MKTRTLGLMASVMAMGLINQSSNNDRRNLKENFSTGRAKKRKKRKIANESRKINRRNSR